MILAAPAATVAEKASGGLPQFDPAPWPGEIVWALAIFLGLYLLIAYVFVPRIGGTIDAREDKIAGDIGDARRARDAAQAEMDAAAGELKLARAKAQKLALDAQAEAKAAAAARRAEQDAALAQTLAAAEAGIATARAEAMVHVRSIAAETAQAMIQRLTGLEADMNDIESALSGLTHA
jgi:F-type H+-transporting ATPase subunit b